MREKSTIKFTMFSYYSNNTLPIIVVSYTLMSFEREKKLKEVVGGTHSSSISAFVSWLENKRVSSLVICKEYLGHRERRGRT
jgi:hypothetical protein